MTKYFNFSKKLLGWYSKNKRDLPWRKTKDPYLIWISEIMLQQTTVKTVIPYFNTWAKRFTTIKDLALASEQDILRLWQGLGYYNRAKNIKKTAVILYENFKGIFPQKYEVLKTLPGFGPYTTGAVLSIAFGQRIPIVDANVRRVISRILNYQGAVDTKGEQKIYHFLEGLLPLNKISAFNQGLMELGALICQNKNPQCFLCPLKNYCAAYEKGTQELIPPRKIRITKKIQAVIAIIKHKNKFFIQKRPSYGLLADLWEFPGGKIKKNEKPLTALKREIKEELRSEVLKATYLFSVQHYYTQYRVHLHVFSCVLKENPPKNTFRQWATLKDLNKYPFPSGSAKIIQRILSTK